MGIAEGAGLGSLCLAVGKEEGIELGKGHGSDIDTGVGIVAVGIVVAAVGIVVAVAVAAVHRTAVEVVAALIAD